MKCQERGPRTGRQNWWLHSRAALIATAVWGFGTSATHAANWEFLPRIDVGALANDNYTLTPNSNEEIYATGGSIDATFAMRATTPLTEFTLAPQLASTYLPGDEDWESNDRFLRLDWDHEGQRFKAALRGHYADEATLSSELPSSEIDGDLGEPDGGDTGFVRVRNRRERLLIAPSVAFNITQRSALLLNAGYDDVSYDQEIPGDTVAYSGVYAYVGYGFQTSPTGTLTVGGTASRYEREADSAETDAYGVRVDWTSRLSDVTRWYLRVGAREVDEPLSPATTSGTRSETSYDGGAGADWRFKVTRLFVDATVSVQPNATGRVVERDELRLRLMRQFSPRLVGHFGARGTRDRALTDELGTFRDRDYATGSVGLEWRMTRELSLLGQYDVTWQEYEDSPSGATANAIQLSIVYERGRGD